MEHKYWFFYTFLLVCAGTVALDVIIQTFKESPGLYYYQLGEAQLYNTVGKIITYINLRDTEESFELWKTMFKCQSTFAKSI